MTFQVEHHYLDQTKSRNRIGSFKKADVLWRTKLFLEINIEVAFISRNFHLSF